MRRDSPPILPGPRSSLVPGENPPQQRQSRPPAPSSPPILGRKILSRSWVRLFAACPVLALRDPLWGGSLGSPMALPGLSPHAAASSSWLVACPAASELLFHCKQG